MELRMDFGCILVDTSLFDIVHLLLTRRKLEKADWKKSGFHYECPDGKDLTNGNNTIYYFHQRVRFHKFHCHFYKREMLSSQVLQAQTNIPEQDSR